MGSFLPLLAQDAPAFPSLKADLMQNLGAAAPEGFLCLMVLVVLLLDVIRHKGPSALYPKVTLAGIAIAVVLVCVGSGDHLVGYNGFAALSVDGLGRLFKLVFLITGALTVVFVMRSGKSYGREGEFQVLMFGALAGMCYLASATELIGFYVAFELVSYTGYLMAGYRLESTKGAEASGKYVIFGSVASGVMLFGITLVFGFTGSTEFSVIAEKLMAVDTAEPALMVGAIFTFAGFAFKAAAFPFQFWCPDVYEGAPAPVAGFLAVASKAAAFAVGLRVLAYGVGATPSLDALDPNLGQLLTPNMAFTEQVLAVAAVGTMTWGNLAALRQNNLQRMLAYSSIAQAGYLLMTACVVLHADVSDDALAAIGFYFLIYLFMNLGAFFIVTLMRRDIGSTLVTDLRGIGHRKPLLASCFAIMLISLTGLPPTAGFVGKFLLFAPVIGEGLFVLATIGLINGAISLYYYAKPMREMFLKEPDETTGDLRVVGFDLALIVALTVPLLFFGLFGWDAVADAARDAVAVAR